MKEEGEGSYINFSGRSGLEIEEKLTLIPTSIFLLFFVHNMSAQYLRTLSPTSSSSFLVFVLLALCLLVKCCPSPGVSGLLVSLFSLTLVFHRFQCCDACLFLSFYRLG